MNRFFRYDLDKKYKFLFCLSVFFSDLGCHEDHVYWFSSKLKHVTRLMFLALTQGHRWGQFYLWCAWNIMRNICDEFQFHLELYMLFCIFSNFWPLTLITWPQGHGCNLITFFGFGVSWELCILIFSSIEACHPINVFWPWPL